MTVVPDRDEQGDVVGLYTLIGDVTSYREAERALQESEARLRTVADALTVGIPGRLTFPIVKEIVRGVLLVSDEEMIETLGWILERMKVVVEPSGGAAAAAVRHRKGDFAGKRIGVILSGGNVDRAKLAEYLSAPAAGGSS